MKKSGFTESRIVPFLRGCDAGLAVGDVCRKHGVSPPTY